MVRCSDCYYNFDGVCANHCYFETFVTVSDTVDYVDDDFDPYGHKCSSLEKKFNSTCDGFRSNPSFLVPQKES